MGVPGGLKAPQARVAGALWRLGRGVPPCWMPGWGASGRAKAQVAALPLDYPPDPPPGGGPPGRPGLIAGTIALSDFNSGL